MEVYHTDKASCRLISMNVGDSRTTYTASDRSERVDLVHTFIMMLLVQIIVVVVVDDRHKSMALHHVATTAQYSQRYMNDKDHSKDAIT